MTPEKRYSPRDIRNWNFIALEDNFVSPMREEMAWNYRNGIVNPSSLAYCYDGLGWVPE